MSVNILPNEILELILKDLDPKSLCSCRRVCRKWKEIVDSRSEIWKQICGRKYWCSLDMYEKGNISWREMLDSFGLWSRIKSTTIKVREVPESCTRIKVLKNNIFSVLIHSKEYSMNSALIYYNSETMEKLERLQFDFPIDIYDENDKLIIIVHTDGRLCVIPKQTKEKYFVGQLCDSYYGGADRQSLFKDRVYFKSSSDMICVSKISKETGKIIIETEELIDFHEYILAFRYFDNNCVNILTDEGHIYCYKNGYIEYTTQIDKWLGHGVIFELWDHGFDYSSEAIFRWLRLEFDRKVLRLSKNATALHRHGRIKITGTAGGIVNIYVNPFSPSGELNLHCIKPDFSVNMHNYGLLNKINYIDVIEIKNGHRIIMHSRTKCMILDLVHNSKERKINSKREKTKTVKQRTKDSLNTKIVAKSKVLKTKVKKIFKF